MPWPQYKVDGTVRAAAGRRGQRWTATICRAHPPPSVAAAEATTAGKGGRWTLTGKGRHRRNTEVDVIFGKIWRSAT